MEQWTPFQCGFRKGHWTESVVISFIALLAEIWARHV